MLCCSNVSNYIYLIDATNDSRILYKDIKLKNIL